MRSADVMTFSGVASNFAGVPLAFAFLATLGRLGLVTVLLRDAVRHRPLRAGLQPPVLLGPDAHLSLLPDPADDPDHHAGAGRAEEGMARGGATLGATGWQYWRMVALPVLWPSLLGTLSLLFANAFGAIATAYRADRLVAQHRADPAVRADPRRRAAAIRISATRWPSA
jgi:putative spermidine/putrescine transport system permease protein